MSQPSEGRCRANRSSSLWRQINGRAKHPFRVPARRIASKRVNYEIPNRSFHFVGLEVLVAVSIKGTRFWVIPQWSSVEVHWRFEGTHRLHLQGQESKLCKKPTISSRQTAFLLLVSCSACSTFLKTEVICSLEMLAHFNRSTRPYSPEARG
jgi:hypothetical protein